MDEKKLAVIAGVTLVLLVLMGLLLMPSKSSRNTGENYKNSGKKNLQGEESSGNSKGRNSRNVIGGSQRNSPYSGPTGVSAAGGYSQQSGSESNPTGAVKQAFTEEEMQELRNKREELRQSIYEKKLSWLQNRSKDPNLSAKSQVRYRLKLIEGFRKGNDALNSKDYAEAIKQYLQGVKDPDGCPVTKFVCFDQMRYAARMMKDYDLYLEILKEQAKLIENEDLKSLGIEKGHNGYRLYESRKRFVMAAKGPDGLRDAIDQYMKDYKLEEDSRAKAEKEFMEDFEEWKKDFEMPG